MNEYVIEKCVPIPKSRPIANRFPLEEMEVGDSILIATAITLAELVKGRKIEWSRMYTQKTARRVKGHFRSGVIQKGKQYELRIWRDA